MEERTGRGKKKRHEEEGCVFRDRWKGWPACVRQALRCFGSCVCVRAPLCVFERERRGRGSARAAHAAGSIGVGAGVRFPLFGFASGLQVDSSLFRLGPQRRLLCTIPACRRVVCCDIGDQIVLAPRRGTRPQHRFLFLHLNRSDHAKSVPQKKETGPPQRSQFVVQHHGARVPVCFAKGDLGVRRLASKSNVVGRNPALSPVQGQWCC